MIMAAMQKKEGPNDTFTMRGEEASPVQYEQETGREFIMYQSPNGEEIKVYGNWSKYAISADEEGRDIISKEDFPVMRNQDGEYVMDEEALDEDRYRRTEEEMPEQEEPEMEGEMEGEGMVQDAEEEMMMMYGGKMYSNGGQVPYSEDPEPPKNTSSALGKAAFSIGNARLRGKGVYQTEKGGSNVGGNVGQMGYYTLKSGLKKKSIGHHVDNEFAGGGKVYAEGGKTSGDPDHIQTLTNTISSMESELRRIVANNPRSEKADSLREKISQLKSERAKAIEDRKRSRMQLRRESQKEQGLVQFKGGGYMKPLKR